MTFSRWRLQLSIIVGHVRHIVTWRWTVLLALMVVTLAGVAVRTIDVTTLPSGLHGDEAILGLESQRVLREGYIGPYSRSALGQPAGPFYAAALFQLLFEGTIFGVRAFTAIIGALTVPVLYLVVSRSLGAGTGLLSAALLAVMGWHIFYSRIGFPLITWPLWVVITAGFVVEACRRKTPLWWTAAGGAAGAGIYTYNAHPLALAAICLFVGLMIVMEYRHRVRNGVIAVGAFAGAALVALLPMIHYAIRNPDHYFGRFSGQTVQTGAGWGEAEGMLDRIRFLVGEYAGFWQRLCCEPVPDRTDGSGVTEMVPLILLIFAAGGMVLGAVRYRTPLVWLGLAIVLIMPLAAVLTEGAVMRRTFAIAPFLALFAALGAVEVVRIIATSPAHVLRPVATVLLFVALTLGVATDLRNYFAVWAESDFQRWVFVEPLTEASLYMRQFDENCYVYLLAERWSIRYETRRYLAPDVQGEDRSKRFGDYPDNSNIEIDLSIDGAPGTPVFILIGNYRELIGELQQRYPGGRTILGGDPADPLFIAYELPAQEP
jgi:hypothetical protein